MISLQVLLWTTCLLSSCAAVSARPEDAGYIIRETVRGPLSPLPRAIPLLKRDVDLKRGADVPMGLPVTSQHCD